MVNVWETSITVIEMLNLVDFVRKFSMTNRLTSR